MKKLIIRVSYMLLISITLFSCDEDVETPPLAVESQIIDLVNEYRKSIGKPELEMLSYISYECRVHSKNMAQGAVSFGHDGFGERVERIKSNIGGGGASGENVAYGYNSAKQVMEGWLNSSGHRANIEGNFSHIGIGAYQHNNGPVYYTQIFIKK
ncbi:CAP domain-containing protein [Fulvivirga kasyanovii]|uniref:CAP domain-containing protein n=1 Tax=Fulvivirga kasyanovii TaxID=396812 RepID=A0ABW9RTN3_9BACT|nr:CAP domain-containing protein [Fulvivirga kasyanovii]MTI26420.1 CAP domain-containing protein [Fulvivirga kasyanovii]